MFKERNYVFEEKTDRGFWVKTPVLQKTDEGQQDKNVGTVPGPLKVPCCMLRALVEVAELQACAQSSGVHQSARLPAPEVSWPLLGAATLPRSDLHHCDQNPTLPT